MPSSIVALIPARSGSKRVPNKNIRPLAGLPLLVWTIKAAQESGIFTHILISSDAYKEIAIAYKCAWILRPGEYAGDISPDFQWVQHAMNTYVSPVDAFAILRPTSPFRTAETIRRAWAAFTADPSSYTSLRAVEHVRQHPLKMWLRMGSEIIPYNPQMIVANGVRQPTHSVPTQLLSEVWVQNASLEMAWTSTLKQGNISGNHVLPFLTEGWEGLDINTEADWLFAEMLIERGLVQVPIVPEKKPIAKKSAGTRKRKVHA